MIASLRTVAWSSNAEHQVRLIRFPTNVIDAALHSVGVGIAAL
jgi:hypothetical protein